MSANTGIFDLCPRPFQRSVSPAKPTTAPASRVSAGPLSVLLLAALVATLVLLADRFVSTWADEHLFLGWVLSWVVIFAGLALFASTARALAAQAIRALDSWSQARARARAEARLWVIAHSDPRVMADLIAIRAHADSESENDFSPALTPVGVEPQIPAPEAHGWAAYIERVSEGRVRNMHLHYI